MSWLWRQRLRAFLRSSLWVIPVLAMVAAMITFLLTRRLNDTLTLPFLDYGLQGARAAVGVIAAAMLTFVVFFFSVLLLTVQIASGNLSPRIIARPFRSNVLKVSLGLFVFTFVYATSVLGRLEERVLELPVFLTLVFTVVSIGVFLFVVEHIGKELRPVSVMAKVAQEGLVVIKNTYPLAGTRASIRQPSLANRPNENDYKSIAHQGHGGVIIAFDAIGLVKLAKRTKCIIELLPQVGDFVGAGTQLFRVYGECGEIGQLELRRFIALGAERTIEQDAAFAFRIIVDIAEKALSPAINDPTTGVLAMDQIQFLLQEVGKRDLSSGTVCDDAGNVRLVYRTPDWEDFVWLGVTEIRQYGANSVQVMRRLRAMLEELIKTLPAERIPLLQAQLELVHASVERQFSDSSDRELAGLADSQGLGGRLSSPARLSPENDCNRNA